jgi:hypothetical protein
LSLSDIKGSPFLDTEYKTATVTTDDGLVYKGIPLRYNAYTDVLEFLKEGASYDLMPKEKVKRAEFGGQVFSYRSYEPGGSNKGYFEILQEGKATLLGRYVIHFYDEEPLQGYAEKKPARFDDFVESYWVSIQEAPAQKVLTSKKLVEILGDKKNEVQTYINKQKLSIKKVNDLKKIIAYYNSL